MSWPELRLVVEHFESAQAKRVAVSSQVRNLRLDPSAFGWEEEAYEAMEKRLSKQMRARLEETAPPGVLRWARASRGIGDHLLTRLLGSIGDPRMAQPYHWEGKGRDKHLVADAPFERTLGQLWQYCGHGRAEHRREGMTAAELFAMGRPRAKMITHLLAESAMKQGIRGGVPVTDYGAVYVSTKARYAQRGHSGECPGGHIVVGKKALFVKCKTGPDGAYAVAGDPFQPSHLHALGLRHLGKRILADLFDAAAEDN